MPQLRRRRRVDGVEPLGHRADAVTVDFHAERRRCDRSAPSESNSAPQPSTRQGNLPVAGSFWGGTSPAANLSPQPGQSVAAPLGPGAEWSAASHQSVCQVVVCASADAPAPSCVRRSCVRRPRAPAPSPRPRLCARRPDAVRVMDSRDGRRANTALRHVRRGLALPRRRGLARGGLFRAVALLGRRLAAGLR